LVKAIEITTTTNDTNIINLKYDPSKRLIEYKSAGKVNGVYTHILYTITRLSDGKISQIVTKSSLIAPPIDSIVYEPHYEGDLLKYVIDRQYTSFGMVRDSTAYTYNVSVQVGGKETFVDLAGTMMPLSKEKYSYGVNGNITRTENFAPNGFGGYDLISTTNFTYNTLKNAVTLREESYIIFPVTTFSKNDVVRQEVVPASGGPTLRTSMTEQMYNTFNRPTLASASVTPQPPGYNLRLLYYYQ
jgi:hypothetical protein